MLIANHEDEEAKLTYNITTLFAQTYRKSTKPSIVGKETKKTLRFKRTFLQLFNKMVDNLLQGSLVNGEEVFQLLDLIEDILRHIGNRPYVQSLVYDYIHMSISRAQRSFIRIQLTLLYLSLEKKN